MASIRIKSKNQGTDLSSGMFLLLLAVAVSNFRLLGSYIIVATGVFFLCFKYYSVKVSPAFCWGFLFACVYFLFTFTTNGFVSAMKIFACPLIWLTGYNMTEARDMKSITRVMLVLAAGMTFHSLLNYVYNISIGTNLTTGRSDDIWSGELSSATGQAINYALFSSMSFWLIFIQPKRFLKLASAVCLFAAVMHMIQLGNRTSLILVMLSQLIGLFAYSGKRGTLKKTLKIMLLALAAALVVLILYNRNVMSLRNYVEDSYLVYRANYDSVGFFALTENSRFSFKRQYLENMFRYPWGGGNLRGPVVGSYAHDLWLDLFDDAGIITLALLLGFTVSALNRILKMGRDRRVTMEESVLLLTYGIIVYLQFFVEPIWQGAPMLFCSFCLIDGMLARFLRDSGAGIRLR